MVGVLRYEWRRISSIRSTWILLALSIVFSAGLAALVTVGLNAANSVSDSDSTVEPAGLLSMGGALSTATTNFVVLVLLGTVAAQAFGQEYRQGTIRLTLTAFPRRMPVFVGKVVVCCLWITAAFVLSLVVSALIFWPQTGIIAHPDSTVSFAAFILRAWLFLMGFCLVVFAVTVLTRILALGVIIPLLLAVVVENLITGLAGSWLPWIGKVLPFTSGNNFVAGEDMVRNGLVYLAWVAVLVAAALVVFERKDA
ncbi:MAG: ABC transporter permease subunit [Candidatus Nanopelagicales bacterium]